MSSRWKVCLVSSIDSSLFVDDMGASLFGEVLFVLLLVTNRVEKTMCTVFQHMCIVSPNVLSTLFPPSSSSPSPPQSLESSFSLFVESKVVSVIIIVGTKTSSEISWNHYNPCTCLLIIDLSLPHRSKFSPAPFSSVEFVGIR